MASSIRSFYQVCCRSYYLRVSTFFPSFVSVFAFFFVLPFSPSFFLPYPLSASHSLKVSFYRTHLKTVHTFRALSSNSLPPPLLLPSVEAPYLGAKSVPLHSANLLTGFTRRVSRFLPARTSNLRATN